MARTHDQYWIIREMERHLTLHYPLFEPESLVHVLTTESMMEILSSEFHLEAKVFDHAGRTNLKHLVTKSVKSFRLSKMVCTHLAWAISCRDVKVTPEEFRLLTHEDYLPYVDAEVAPKLIKYEEEICGESHPTAQGTERPAT